MKLHEIFTVIWILEVFFTDVLHRCLQHHCPHQYKKSKYANKKLCYRERAQCVCRAM